MTPPGPACFDPPPAPPGKFSRQNLPACIGEGPRPPPAPPGRGPEGKVGTCFLVLKSKKSTHLSTQNYQYTFFNDRRSYFTSIYVKITNICAVIDHFCTKVYQMFVAGVAGRGQWLLKTACLLGFSADSAKICLPAWFRGGGSGGVTDQNLPACHWGGGGGWTRMLHSLQYLVSI